jgi:hypothetical protein
MESKFSNVDAAVELFRIHNHSLSYEEKAERLRVFANSGIDHLAMALLMSLVLAD